MERQSLITGWRMQSSAMLTESGETISTSRYDDAGWLPATVPGSVVASLAAAGVYPDTYTGLAMRNLPGYKTGRTTHFSRHPMPADSPFRKTWWYRAAFHLPETASGQHVWLLVNGVNYRADI